MEDFCRDSNKFMNRPCSSASAERRRLPEPGLEALKPGGELLAAPSRGCRRWRLSALSACRPKALLATAPPGGWTIQRKRIVNADQSTWYSGSGAHSRDR